VHPYPGDQTPQAGIDYGNSCFRPLNGTKPLMATETGYSIISPSWLAEVNELAAAKYGPRLLLANFNAGWPRTHLYELIGEDVPGQVAFGLMTSSGAERQTYSSVANLIALVADSGAAYTAGRLNFTLTGDLTNVKRTLLQKRDGRFYLAVWQEVRVWQNGQDLTTPTRAVTLTLASPATMRVYRPRTGAAPIQTATGTTINLAVPDEVIVVEITR
jgi:hypothetical protein